MSGAAHPEDEAMRADARRWREFVKRVRFAGTSRTFDAYREHWQITLPGPHRHINNAIDEVISE